MLLMENVPQVIQSGSIKDFQKWRYTLEQLGYTNYCEILNAKDYGIPQNRQRCFMVSIYGEYHYEFPLKVERKYKLKDFLENEVDEKYYLSDENIERISNLSAQQKPLEAMKKTETNGYVPTLTARGAGEEHSGMILIGENKQQEIITVGNVGNGHHSKDVIDPKGIMATITTGNHSNGQLIIRNNNSKGYEIAEEGDGIDISSRMEQHRGTVQKGKSQTLTCQGGNNVGVVVDTLKKELCNHLIESGQVKEGDIVKHSYTAQIMAGKKKAVEKSDEMITLTTRCDCLGVCIDEQSIDRNTEEE